MLPESMINSQSGKKLFRQAARDWNLKSVRAWTPRPDPLTGLDRMYREYTYLRNFK